MFRGVGANGVVSEDRPPEKRDSLGPSENDGSVGSGEGVYNECPENQLLEPNNESVLANGEGSCKNWEVETGLKQNGHFDSLKLRILLT